MDHRTVRSQPHGEGDTKRIRIIDFQILEQVEESRENQNNIQTDKKDSMRMKKDSKINRV